jgi:hypothetical protein
MAAIVSGFSRDIAAAKTRRVGRACAWRCVVRTSNYFILRFYFGVPRIGDAKRNEVDLAPASSGMAVGASNRIADGIIITSTAA